MVEDFAASEDKVMDSFAFSPLGIMAGIIPHWGVWSDRYGHGRGKTLLSFNRAVLNSEKNHFLNEKASLATTLFTL